MGAGEDHWAVRLWHPLHALIEASTRKQQLSLLAPSAWLPAFAVAKESTDPVVRYFASMLVARGCELGLLEQGLSNLHVCVPLVCFAPVCC